MPTPSPSTELLSLLDACAARGIAVSLGENGALKVRAPAGKLTPELREALKAHKTALTHLLQAQADGSEQTTPIPPRPADQPAPLSSAQVRLWFLNQLDPRSIAAYNIVAAVRITGPLQIAALRAAVAALAARHETLRTAFRSVAGQPEQVIAPTVTVPWTADTVRAEDVADRLRAEAEQAFDLTQAPLLRTTLLEIGATEHVFIFTIHHLISDGWSSGVIVRDLAAFYTAAAAGQAPEKAELPSLRTQFGDYAAWQTQRQGSAAAERDLAFWVETLAGTTVLNLPTDHPRPPAMSYAGATRYETFPAELSAGLNALAQREQATLFQVLLAAFQVLLQRLTGQTDIAIGTSIANRNHPDLEPLIGFLTNTLVMRTDLAGNPSFRELLVRTKATAAAAYAHAETPLERIIETLQPERSMSQNPLFQVCFSLLQAHRDTLRLGEGLTLEQLNVDSPSARFDLSITVENTRQGLLVAFEYSRDLFEPATIERLMGLYQTLLHGIVADPDQALADYALLTPPERHALLVERNQSATAYPSEATIPDLFAEVVARQPDTPAVKFGARELSYAELDRLSNQLAHHLQAQGVGIDEAVAVSAERSIEMVVGLLAVLKAGAHYLPFDPTDPIARLQQVFDQSRPRFVLAAADAVEHLPDLGATAIPVSLHDAPWSTAPDTRPVVALSPENLAYTTFTSGSTGTPKGICIPHRGVVRLVRNTNYLNYGPDLRILELATVAFDASTFELWGALCNGALLVVWRPGPPSIRELADLIERERITTLYLTSALFNLMVDERVEAFATVRHLLVGGDIISPPHARRVLAAHAELTLINGYGPTETTTFAACGMLRSPEDVGHSVTIGPPMSNTTLYILDAKLEPVPVGVPGDLYIGGDGNARGYLGRPDLTAEAFVPHPHPRTPGERLYRTGDLARWAEDGTAEFLGRRDFQVKVRGFRIELGEIESALVTHAAVEKALVLAEGAAAGEKRLLAFVQPPAGAPQPTPAELQEHLTARLPDYMVPAAFHVVSAFPLNANGKVVRADLLALAAAAPTADAVRYTAPASAVEDTVAGLWGEVLGADRLGRQDNFFDRGGHSLLATKIMWRLYEIFATELPLRLLFDHPTVRGFAAALSAKVDADHARPGRAEAVARIHGRVRDMTDEEVRTELAARRG